MEQRDRSANEAPENIIARLQETISSQASEIFSLKSIISKLPVSVYWKNRDGVYLGCNDFVLEMSGKKDRSEVIGKTDFELPWKSYATELRDIDEKIMLSNAAIEIEENPTLASGRQCTMLTRKAPLQDENDKIIGVIGVSIDITDRKRMEAALKEAKEKAEAANKAKTEFLENMRHDIRTPLTGIVGYANIIKDEIDDPKTKQDISNLVVSSHALLDLLNEILESIKISSGELPIFKKKFTLEPKLQEVIKLNQSKAKQKNLLLDFEYDANIPHYLVGDSTRIHRIVLELLTNALNFTEKGFVKLSAYLEKHSGKDLVIKIIVEDTGIGMPLEKQQDIFVQFNRLNPAYKGIYRGSGLGLSIVKQFIDDLKGEIYVESKSPNGVRFTCLIPLVEALLDEPFGCEQDTGVVNKKLSEPFLLPTTLDACASTYSTNLKKTYVLLVEDHAMSAKVVQTILNTLCCQVDVAADGQTAIELSQKNTYDIVFVDIGLPDIDGYEVAKRIRLYELNKGKHVPIIALTAHVDDENKRRCIDAGMNFVLSKPLIKEIADQTLNKFIPFRKSAKKELSDKKESSNNAMIIDLEIAKQVTNNNAKMLEEILLMFAASLTEETKRLKNAYSSQDWKLIADITHKINGGARYCGALRLKEACKNLDESIKTNGSEELCSFHYKALLTEIDTTQEYIQQL